MKTLMWLFLIAPVLAGADIPLQPARVDLPPQIDGALTDPVWNQALVVSDFIQRLPKEGATPTESTDFLFLYTSDSIYIGVRALDSRPNSIVATVMRRDDFDVVENDQIAIAIDSYNDGLNGYWFSTNPLGVRVDAQFFNEGEIFESNWDGIWYCKAQRTSEGWMAEIQIPFSTLRFHDGDQHIMGINLFRRIIRTNEQIFAPLIPLQYANGTPNVSVARKYMFENISGGGDILVRPYVLGGLQNERLEISEDQSEKEAGLDIRYSVTDNLLANISYNTDFAETEVDERQINLTRFSLFLPEKREFFLENAGNFLFGLPQETELFFSRRIGIAEDTDGNTLSVPILLGGKITGKVKGIDIGILDVHTKSDGVFPADNFGVARLKAGVAPRSYVGTLFTNKISSGGYYDRTYGADWNLFFWNDIAFTGFAAANTSSGLGTSSAYYVALVKGGELTSFNLGWMDMGSGFDPDIGFVRRPGTERLNAGLNVPVYLQTPTIRRFVPGFSSLFYRDQNGEPQDSFQSASFLIDLQSDDQVLAFANRSFERVPGEFPIFHSVIVPGGEYSWYDAGISITTKPGRRLSGLLEIVGGGLYDGSHIETGGSLNWKINKHLTIGQSYNTNKVDLPGGSFRTHLARSRLSYSLNTSFSVDALVQYDNESDQFGLNLRVAYIFREGTELFFVFNEITNESELVSAPHERLHARSALVKFTYLFQW